MHPRTWIAIAALAGCGGAAVTAGGARLETQHASADTLHIVAFDAHDVVASVLPAGTAFATMALALPDGDWLVGFGRVLLRLSPDGQAVRWTRELAIRGAIAVSDDLVIAIRYDADHDGAIIGLRGDGSVAWQTPADAIARARLELVRAAGLTVIVGDAGELAVDDAGTVRWARDDRRDRTLTESIDGVGVVVVTSAHTSLEVADTPRRQPLIARVLDPLTGAQRAVVAVAPDGDSYSPGQLARAGNRLVVRAHDVRAVRAGSSMTADVHRKLIVLTATAGAIAVSDVFDDPVPVETLAALPDLGREDALFVGGFAGGGPLDAEIIDLASHRARSAPLIRQLDRASADGAAYTQVLHVVRTGDRITFVGRFAGAFAVGHDHVRADVHWSEGSEGQRTYTASPFIGTMVIGRASRGDGSR